MAKTVNAVEALADEHLACRDLGHAWNHNTDGDIIYEDYVAVEFVRFMKCLRCGSARIQRIDISTGTFDVISSRITYPDGYLFTRGAAPKGGRRAMRQEQFWRYKWKTR